MSAADGNPWREPEADRDEAPAQVDRRGRERRTAVRARTVSVRRLSKRELALDARITTSLDLPEHRRPTSRRAVSSGRRHGRMVRCPAPPSPSRG